MSLFALLMMAAQSPAAPQVAAPARDQVAFDTQCMLASQSASNKLKGAQKSGAQLATMFYFGRVDSALSGAALQARIAAEAKALESKPLAPLLQQCADFMQTRAKALEAVAAGLKAK